MRPHRIVTGTGLARALGEKFPRPLVATVALALLITNTITVGADLSAMADASEMLSGVISHYYVVLFGVAIGLGTILFRYRRIVNVLKWFALSLLAYMLTAFVVHPDWNAVLHETFLPTWPTGHAAWAGLVAILGATISPYLFFWQASMELEEKRDPHPVALSDRVETGAQRLSSTTAGYRRWHTVLKSRHVFHYPDHGAHAAPQWRYQYRYHA